MQILLKVYSCLVIYAALCKIVHFLVLQTNSNFKANELILGTPGSDIINDKNGDDCVVGGGSDDSLFGDNSNDILVDDPGSDTLDDSKCIKIPRFA